MEELPLARPRNRILWLVENTDQTQWVLSLDHVNAVAVIRSFLSDLQSDNYLHYEFSSGSLHGIIIYGTYSIQVNYSAKDFTFIVSDIAAKTMKVVISRNNTITVDYMEKTIIDLSPYGDRWEGSSLNDKPFGYGSLFDSNDHLLFSGFMFNQEYVCWGQTYSGSSNLLYKGHFYNSYFWGPGCSYNLHNEVDYEGIRYCGSTVEADKRNSPFISYLPEEMILDDKNIGHSGGDCFQLVSFFVNVKRITITESSFQSIRVVNISDLPNLTHLTVEKSSFLKKEETNIEKVYPTVISKSCNIEYCPSLQEIIISDLAFKAFHSLTVRDLPALRRLVFGMECFCFAYAFQLKGIYKYE